MVLSRLELEAEAVSLRVSNGKALVTYTAPSVPVSKYDRLHEELSGNPESRCG